MSTSAKYAKRSERYGKLAKRQQKMINNISNLRFLVFFAGLGVSVLLYLYGYLILLAAAILASAFLFGFLVRKHGKVIENKKYSFLLKDININSQKRLNGEWTNFPDAGEDFASDSHSYSGDLDIFGKGSLYQMISTCGTGTGREELAGKLAKQSHQVADIMESQEAVSELAGKLAWRQRYQAESMLVHDDSHKLGALFEWACSINHFYLKPAVIAALRILPALTIMLMVSGFIFHIIPAYIPVAALILQFSIIKYKAKERLAAFNTAEQYKEVIRTYYRMLGLFENKDFRSGYLMALKAGLADSEGKTAVKQVKKLIKIMDSISNRYNMFYVIYDVITLWDYQCLSALEKWKSDSGTCLRKWFDVIGEVEALSSLAVLRYDHEDWAVPEFEEKAPVFKAEAMGHPLLSDTRVCNTLSMGAGERILLITGSNMSGKSTLLRTAGINLVLAYAGAPVCARRFSCTVMNIYTCMRVSDSLEKSTSSFYAELLRIKNIVEAVEKGEQVFFLLDEIFKGTNSIDRHTGAKTLVKRLNRDGVLGLVSTHDLELGALEQEAGEIRNYHFREYYRDNKIFFDYILRSGISTTRNAAYLMRMAGILDR